MFIVDISEHCWASFSGGARGAIAQLLIPVRCGGRLCGGSPAAAAGGCQSDGAELPDVVFHLCWPLCKLSGLFYLLEKCNEEQNRCLRLTSGYTIGHARACLT